MNEISAWQNFYIIVGSSAGALIGLQFVFITLLANRPSHRIAQAGAAFATPTIVHFSFVLFISAILSAPWRQPMVLALLNASMGIAGLIYMAIIFRRMRAQGNYQPVWEDWIFHAIVPILSYMLVAAAGPMTFADPETGLDAIGISLLLLLLCGIHNAWDAVIYHLLHFRPGT